MKVFGLAKVYVLNRLLGQETCSSSSAVVEMPQKDNLSGPQKIEDLSKMMNDNLPIFNHGKNEK